ncbi:hypothetical protein BCR37DRAFT_394831 [Protomyces lactucae-debilis]|uniref:Amidohydrolase-related domain-containing protein n=1 Tax=Protomyces lactucae-debilis TaxID=2754530 RepID=A0A1Y2F1I7_PROLT|nr:uncharacterized protein BCR37DRAFT_394831 [Protomyces lactucae-debilis]ORY77738.1 hypothetical protein BCR37DRAFT_394831 [Protomyces lactucae-debilis]
MTLVVDAHVHLWTASRLQHLRWLTSDSSLNKACTLADYAKEFPAQVAVFVECDVFECKDDSYALAEIEEALAFAKEEGPTKVGAIVAWAPMLASQAELAAYLDKVDATTHRAGLAIVRGFRYLLQQKPRSISQHPHLRSNLVFLERRWPKCVFELGIDVHRDGVQVLDDALVLVQTAPGISFVIDHLAKADLTQASISEAYKQGMKALSKFPNVHVKISGCLTEVEVSGSFEEVLEQSPLVAHLSFLLKTFGSSRLIWATPRSTLV